jgi:hypothetical protein
MMPMIAKMVHNKLPMVVHLSLQRVAGSSTDRALRSSRSVSALRANAS